MTDFRSVPPPLDGLQLAMASARRRRMRTASVTTGFGASLALVVPLLLGSTGQSSVLLPEPDVKQPAVTTSDAPATPAPGHVIAAGQPNTAPDLPGTAAGQAAPTSITVSPGPTPSTGRVSGPARSVGSSRPSVPYVAGPMRRDDDQYGQIACLGTNDENSATGLCTTGMAYGSSDGTYSLQAYACNLDTQAAPVTFPGANEVDFTVRSAKGAKVWTWSQWHPQTERVHTIVVPQAACTVWTFDWTAVDATGRRVPAGSYHLDVTFLTSRLQAQSTDFSVS